MFSHFLFAIYVMSSFFMLGIIWFVQVVHYPMFNFLRYDDGNNPHKEHQKRTSYVIVPAMFLELGSNIWMLFHPYPSFIVVLILLVLTIVILGITFIVQVPCHHSLKREPSKAIIDRLVKTNWVRTFLWSAKGIFLLLLIWFNLKVH